MEDNYFETEILQIMAGKEYTFVFELEIPEDKNEEDDFIEVEFNYYDKEGNKAIKKNKIEKMDENNKEKANEEYLRVAIFDDLKEAAILIEEDKEEEVLEKINNIEQKMNNSSNGIPFYHDYSITDTIELLKSSDFHQKTDNIQLNARLREGTNRRGGSGMLYQNKIQKEMVE